MIWSRRLIRAPAAAKLAASRGLRAGLISDDPTDEQREELYYSRSDWVVVTRNGALLAQPSVAAVLEEIEISEATPLWTDGFNNLVRILK